MRREEHIKDDLISRQAVLDMLQNEYIEISITDAGREEYTIAEINVDALKALPSVKMESMNGNWISVTDRLPDVGDTFIVTIEYKGKIVGVDAAEFVFTNDGYIDGKWNTWNDWKEGPDILYHVSAWMPLPEPYKDEMEV